MTFEQSPMDMCKCHECGWQGKCAEAIMFLNQETWEMPQFEDYECPECGAEIDDDDYWYSEELANDL